jgi:hypothetical protein
MVFLTAFQIRKRVIPDKQEEIMSTAAQKIEDRPKLETWVVVFFGILIALPIAWAGIVGFVCRAIYYGFWSGADIFDDMFSCGTYKKSDDANEQTAGGSKCTGS